MQKLRHLVTAAQRDLDRSWRAELRELDLTVTEAEALRTLDQFGTLAVRDLGDLLVRETGSPSRVAARLVHAGLAERWRGDLDLRTVAHRLTDAGMDRVEDVRAAEQSLHDRLEADLCALPVSAGMAVLDAIADGPAGRAARRRYRPDIGSGLVPW